MSNRTPREDHSASHLATGRGRGVADEWAGFAALCRTGDAERLLAGLVPAGGDECWLWSGGVDEGGYGVLSVARRPARTHRLAYALVNGPIPRGRVVMHACDVPHCGRPSHLRLGTQADNIADKMSKGRHRTSGPRLTTRQVDEMRARYAAGGCTQGQLASAYGLTRQTVWRILHEVSWAPGSRAVTARLDDAAVQQIRARHEGGESQQSIADSLGVTGSYVSAILAGRRKRGVA